MTVIKAQDQASKVLIKEEEELQKKSKLRYKEELDKQLQFKNKVNKNQLDEKQDELSFHLAQQLAVKNFENKKKLDDRSYLQIFMNDNQEDQGKRYRQLQDENEKQKMMEKQRIRQVQRELEEERLREAELKTKRVREEQEELRRQIVEKISRAKMQEVEKGKDRRMIEKKIEEMKGTEVSYREFYEKRMQNMEKKLHNFQPIAASNMYKQELIQRRNEEWEVLNREKQERKAKTEEVTKARALSELKYNLEKQMEEKHKSKVVEIEEDKRQQVFAQLKAREERLEKSVERDKKMREKDELKNAYMKQVEERDKVNMQSLMMDARERKMHNGILKNLNDNQIIAFPGVPGVHTKESPIKQSYNRIYASPAEKYRKVEESESFRKVSKTPTPFSDVSKSYEYSLSKRNYEYPDPFKHDPITNPIGSQPPRVLPGERIVKGMKSASRLAMAGNALFKNS